MPTEKLTVDRIRELFKQGYTVERIKREFGGSKDRIRKFRDIQDDSENTPKIDEEDPVLKGHANKCQNCEWQTEMDGYRGCGAITCHPQPKQTDRPTGYPTDRPQGFTVAKIYDDDLQNIKQVLRSNRMNLKLRALLLKLVQ